MFLYTAFLWTMSTAAICGFSFNGIDEKTKSPKFDKVISCYFVDSELAWTVSDFANTWNVQVARWLRYYVYERLIKPG